MIDGDEGGMLFLDAFDGTDKTFLLNLILAKLPTEGKISLAIASSRIRSFNIINWKPHITRHI